MTSCICVPPAPAALVNPGDVAARQSPGGPDPADLDRLASVRAQVREAAASAGREAGSVRLMLATKTIEPARILAVVAAGQLLIGENRVQEVVEKAGALAGSGHECHLIGHLQSNKINQVLPHVTCVQSVDSAGLGVRLDSRIAALERTLDVLVQVNVSGEPTKSGVSFAALPQLLADLAPLESLRVRGFMTVGLNSDDLGAVRAGYRRLTDFRDRARAAGMPGTELAIELSMGMSGDFAEAIAEGATLVRVGSAVFGRRAPLTG